jgi:glycosyltransferase involved in cell wall biosynthesis
MRVAWLCHSSAIGGAELCLHEAALAVRDDVAGCLFVPTRGPLCGRLAVPWRQVHYVAASGGRRTWLERRVSNLRALPALRRTVKDFDVVVSNSLVLTVGALAAAAAGVPHIWYLHEKGLASHGGRPDFGRPATLAVVGALSREVWATSAYIARAHAPWLPRQPEVIHPAPDLPLVDDGLRLPRRAAFEIAVVGSLTRGKRVVDVARAVVSLARRGQDVHLRVVGHPEASCVAELERLRAEAPGRVEVSTYDPNIAAVMRSADVVVCAAVDEAFGRVIVEAQAAGTPVIASNSGGHDEAVEHDVTGLLVPPDDGPALEAALLRLAHDVALRARLVEGARARLGRFSKERLRAQVLAGLARVVER